MNNALWSPRGVRAGERTQAAGYTRPISTSSQLSAQWAETSWGAEPRLEPGPASQQASALPTEPHYAPKMMKLLYRINSRSFCNLYIQRFLEHQEDILVNPYE